MRKLYQSMSSCSGIAAQRPYRVVIAARAKRLGGLGCFHLWRQHKSAAVNSGMVWWAVIHTFKTVRAFSQRSVAKGAGQFRMCAGSSSCSGQRGHSAWPDLNHFSTAKVAGSMLCNPTFLSSGQVGKRLANQFPVNSRDVAHRHATSSLTERFGSRFHNGIIQLLFVHTAEFAVLEGDRPVFIFESLWGRAVTIVIQIVPVRLCHTVHINIGLYPFVERGVRGTVVLMSLDPFPVNLDRQPTDFCSDVRKQIVVWTRRRQGSVL
jgi:hypothetical protein